MCNNALGGEFPGITVSSIPEMDNSGLNPVCSGLAIIEHYKIISRRDLPRYCQRNEKSLPPTRD